MGYGFGHSPGEGVFLNGKSNWSVSFHSFDLEKEDSWVWKDGEAISYTAKSAYNRLRRGREGKNVIVFKQLWRCKTLPFALVTAWRVLENKLATRVNLEKCGIAVESPLCSLCRVEVESNNHLFFECSFA
ncbi:uncharacterized protein [Phaseolus vulgaris]|uniref:uncharacterized protein n=1 Tax=Phaseolus vulgaris TaxID=3885 RepID=UPI0035CAA39F